MVSVRVSTHAILRYIERVYGVCLADLRAKTLERVGYDHPKAVITTFLLERDMTATQLKDEIVPPNVAKQISLLSTGRFPVGSTHWLVTNNGNVLTVLEGMSELNSLRRRRRRALP